MKINQKKLNQKMKKVKRTKMKKKKKSKKKIKYILKPKRKQKNKKIIQLQSIIQIKKILKVFYLGLNLSIYWKILLDIFQKKRSYIQSIIQNLFKNILT